MSLAAYIALRDAPGSEHRGRAATMAPGNGSRVHGPLGVRVPGRTPAHTQRQDRPPGPPRPRAGTAPSRVPISYRREGRSKKPWPKSGPSCLAAERSVRHDNFFERGGHSLLAVQLLSRLRQTFEVEVSLPDFLEDPTVSRLARIVEQALEDGTAPSAPPLVPVERDAPLPASFAQQRLWFLDQLEPGRASYHIPAAVKLVGRLDIPALERALNEVVRRHEALRTTLVADGGIPHQVIAARLRIATGRGGSERPSRRRARSSTPRTAFAKKPSGRLTWRADRSSVPRCCD